MTIRKAIELLQAIAVKHGDDVEVFYDCEHCGKSTRPDYVAAAVSMQKAPTK